MKTMFGPLIVALTILASPISQAAGNASEGEKKAAACAACHGADGQAQISTHPNLAGQNEQYLVMALQAYKAGQRQGGQAPVMAAQAASLSDQDIENLAAYYHSLAADNP